MARVGGSTGSLRSQGLVTRMRALYACARERGRSFVGLGLAPVSGMGETGDALCICDADRKLRRQAKRCRRYARKQLLVCRAWEVVAV